MTTKLPIPEEVVAAAWADLRATLSPSDAAVLSQWPRIPKDAELSAEGEAFLVRYMRATRSIWQAIGSAVANQPSARTPAPDPLAGRLFLTVPEFADLLRADPRSVRRGITAGDIPAVKVGGITRIPVPKVREMLGLE